MNFEKTLRLVTYMSPGIPLELFQVYQRYLEYRLQCHSYLMVESRWSGPPHTVPNPFTEDHADIGFVCGTSYLEMAELDHNPHVDLLPVAPVFLHEMNHGEPVMFTDIIVSKDKINQVKSFEDLKGHTWAYNDEISLSGHYSVLAELKKRGTDTSFFKDVVLSGSHHNSITMVKDGVVDCAGIDSNVLRQWYIDHPDDRNVLHTLTSLGPLPIQPIVYNTRITDELKAAIIDAMLNMNKSPEWRRELAKFNVWGFKPIQSAMYDKEREIVSLMAADRKTHIICNGYH